MNKLYKKYKQYLYIFFLFEGRHRSLRDFAPYIHYRKYDTLLILRVFGTSHLQLISKKQNMLYPNGYNYRSVKRNLNALKKAGLVRQPKRGYYELSKKGTAVIDRFERFVESQDAFFDKEELI